MPKFLVIVVNVTRVIGYEPGHPQVPKVRTEVDEKEKWGLVASPHSAIVFERGSYAPCPEGHATVIDMESPFEISKAVSNAVRLLQYDLKRLLDISPFT